MTVRLLLADDQELVRTALGALLELEDDFEVVASVGRGDEVAEAATKYQPDVALLDIEMPGLDGLSVAAVLAAQVPKCRSVILTTFGRAGYLRRAMEAGAVGFVVKDAPAEALGDTIRRVMSGEQRRRSRPRRFGPRGRGLAADPQGARCPDRHPHRGQRRRDRPNALPLGGDGTELPLGRHRQDGGAQPPGRPPHCRTAGLALTAPEGPPAPLAGLEPAVAPRREFGVRVRPSSFAERHS